MECVYEVRIGLRTDVVWKTRTLAKAKCIAKLIEKKQLGRAVIREITYDPNDSLAKYLIRGTYVEDVEESGCTELMLQCCRYR